MLAIIAAMIPMTFALFLALGLGKMRGEGPAPKGYGAALLFTIGLIVVALVLARYA